MDSPNLSFQTCYGTFMGPRMTTFGIHLFYATDAHTVEQADWVNGTTEWTIQGRVTVNGNAGLGCYAWNQTSSVMYLMFINLDNDGSIMWKDQNTSMPSTSEYPTGTWKNSSVLIANILPISNIGFNGYMVVQLPDLTLLGNNISFDAQNTQLMPNEEFHISQTSIPSTHLWLWELPTDSKDEQLSIVNQINGTDITATTRDMVSGQVSNQPFRIPNT
jgi:hypothetical protein